MRVHLIPHQQALPGRQMALGSHWSFCWFPSSVGRTGSVHCTTLYNSRKAVAQVRGRVCASQNIGFLPRYSARELLHLSLAVKLQLSFELLTGIDCTCLASLSSV